MSPDNAPARVILGRIRMETSAPAKQIRKFIMPRLYPNTFGIQADIIQSRNRQNHDKTKSSIFMLRFYPTMTLSLRSRKSRITPTKPQSPVTNYQLPSLYLQITQ